jgi:hypothetical protein
MNSASIFAHENPQLLLNLARAVSAMLRLELKPLLERRELSQEAFVV